MNDFLSLLLSINNPVLPSPAWLRSAMYVEWALVLGAGAYLLAMKLARPYSAGVGLLVILWTMLPGVVSPAYWLGLAFQTPSLTSAVLCLVWLFRAMRVSILSNQRGEWPHFAHHDNAGTFPLWALVGVLLGWVLLLDALAWLPLSMSIYAWGFSPAAVGAVALVAAICWMRGGTSITNLLASGKGAAALILLVLVLFVMTRLPTGNVWDALIDPCLWIGLQGWGLFKVQVYLRLKRRSPAAIHV